MRPLPRSLTPLLLALSVATCSDILSGPATTSPARTSLSFAPRFSPAAQRALDVLAAAAYDVQIDRVRVVVVRPQTDTLGDTTVVFPVDQDAIPVSIPVIARPGETLGADLYYGVGPNQVLFQGHVAVTVQPPGSTGTPPEIPITFVGPGATATRLLIDPAGGTYSSLAPVAFTHRVFDASGASLSGVPVAWSTSDGTVATISRTGTLQFTGKGGTVDVVAQIATPLTARVTLAFVPPVSGPASIAISPAGGTITALGDLLALSATVRDAGGNAITGAAVTWTSRAPAVASVDVAGMVVAVGNGTARIVATAGTAGTASDSVVVTVQQAVDAVLMSRDTLLLVAVGDTGTIRATPLDRNKNAATNHSPVYASSNAAVATVDAAGLVTLRGDGTAVITATAGGKQGTAVVVSNGASVPVTVGYASLRVTPATASMRVGDTLGFSAVLVNADGTTAAVTPLWATSAPGRTSIDGGGQVIAFDTATVVTITATSAGVAGHAALTVLPAPVLRGFGFTPTTVSASATPTQVVTISAWLDDVGSGVSSMTVTFTAPDGTLHNCGVTSPTSGTRASGTWTCPLPFPAGSPTGSWHVTGLTAVGTITRTYNESALSAYGTTTLTVNP